MHATEVAAQLAQAGKDAAHQRREHEKEARALRDALDAAGQQTALAEAAVREIQARIEAQTAATTEATARWTQELQRSTERAETQRAAATKATWGCEAAQKRAAALQEQLNRTVIAASTQRDASELTRNQDHILQLCEVRAAGYARVQAAWIAGVQAGRSEAQPQLSSLLAPVEQDSGSASAPRTLAPASPCQPAEPPPGPGAIGRRRYPVLEQAMKRS